MFEMCKDQYGDDYLRFVPFLPTFILINVHAYID